jgi:(p)ppGpp synthase/HD superfamily hydrolase
MNLLDKAILFAKQKHYNQKDDNGNYYFESHCCQVAEILKLVTNDENLIAAGYLHDTLEDTSTNYDELKLSFNKDVADLVLEVTKAGEKDSKGFYFPNLITQRGIILKFADRLSNLSRMESWGEKRKEQYLRKSKFWKTE